MNSVVHTDHSVCIPTQELDIHRNTHFSACVVSLALLKLSGWNGSVATNHFSVLC